MSNRPNAYSADSPGEQPREIPNPGPTEALSHEQLLRLAEVIAAGEADFPVDREISPTQQQVLLDEVRRCRRTRLSTYLARQIALNLFQTQREHGRRTTGA